MLGTLTTYTLSSSLDWFRVGKVSRKREACGVLHSRESDVCRSAQRSRVRPDESQNCSVQNSLEIQQNTIYVCNLKVAQKKGLQFYQTRSNVIIVQQSVSVFQITAKSRTQAEFVSWTSGSFLISKREHPSTIKAKRAGKSVAKSSGKPEAVTSTSEYKVFHSQPFNRRMMFAEIHQFETHPNRESLMADSDKNQKFILFIEKSKELIRSMGITKYFEMCEITSKVQCQDCLLDWEMRFVFFTCGKCLQLSSKNRRLYKDRFDVFSIPNYVNGPTERQRIYHKAHNTLRKANKKGHKTMLARFLNSPRCRDT